MASSAVPVAGEGFGVEGDSDAPLLSHADEKEPVGKHSISKDLAERDGATDLAIQRWSPMSWPGQGPTWNSH